MFGDGEPRAHWSATDAAWMGLIALREGGVAKGTVLVFAPGGERMAGFPMERAWPTFGAMKWQPARVWSVSAADIEAAAEKEES